MRRIKSPSGQMLVEVWEIPETKMGFRTDEFQAQK